MENQIFVNWQTIISDAIKILGPAIITAFVAYKAGAMQANVRMKELDKTNEFRVREKMFDVNREKLNRLEKSQQEFNKSLGEMLGTISFEESIEHGLLGTLNKMMESYYKSIFLNIKSALKEMKENKLDDTDEYSNLKQYLSKMTTYKQAKNKVDLENAFYALMELQGNLVDCEGKVLAKQADTIFKKYLV